MRSSVRQYSSRRQSLQVLLFCLIVFVVGCRGSSGLTEVVSDEVMVAGEEVVVTREVPRPVQAPATVTPAATQEPVILDIGQAGAPQTADPQRARSQSEIDLVENLYVGLTRLDHRGETVAPELATSWEVSEDGLTWTFYLRDDIYWIRSDLTQQTSVLPTEWQPQVYRRVIADDFVFAVQRACDPRTQAGDVLALYIIVGCERVHSENVVSDATLQTIGVRAPDATTVVVELTEPAAYLPTIASMPLVRPVPREIVEVYDRADSSWATVTNMLASGRFVIGDASEADVLTVLVRNPFWPDPFSGTVDQVYINWLDVEAAYQMWLEKDLDISPLPASRLEAVNADARYRPRLHLISNQSAFFLTFNFDSPVFADANVRRAFMAAVNRQELIETVYGGRGLPMRHLTPPGALGAPPLDEVGTGYSPDRARQMMAESSLRDCSFLPQIRYLVSDTDLALFHAETLRSMWEDELGCPEEQIVIEQVPLGTLLAETRSGAATRPEIWDLGWSAYMPDAHNWLGTVVQCRIGENRQHRPCAPVDDLIAEAARTPDLAERITLYRQAEQMLFSDGGVVPLIPLFVQAQYRLIQPWLTYEPAHFGGEQYDTIQLDAVTKRLERAQ